MLEPCSALAPQQGPHGAASVLLPEHVGDATGGATGGSYRRSYRQRVSGAIGGGGGAAATTASCPPAARKPCAGATPREDLGLGETTRPGGGRRRAAPPPPSSAKCPGSRAPADGPPRRLRAFRSFTASDLAPVVLGQGPPGRRAGLSALAAARVHAGDYEAASTERWPESATAPVAAAAAAVFVASARAPASSSTPGRTRVT